MSRSVPTGDPPPVKASEFLAALSHASDYADPAADTGLATARRDERDEPEMSPRVIAAKTKPRSATEPTPCHHRQLFDDDAAAAGLRGEVEVKRLVGSRPRGTIRRIALCAAILLAAVPWRDREKNSVHV